MLLSGPVISQGCDPTARHGRDQRPGSHCRLLIADCGGRKSKLGSTELQRRLLRVSNFEFRISSIGNSGHPGPSHDRRKPPPHEKKMKTSAPGVWIWRVTYMEAPGRLRQFFYMADGTRTHFSGGSPNAYCPHGQPSSKGCGAR
jgi:hypothetical protein